MSLSNLEEHILILLRGKELTDQHILQALRDAGIGCESAMVYSTLRKMERKGLISSYTNRRLKQIEAYYQLTLLAERGLDRLQSIRLILSGWHPPIS
jgi:DNA-binding PadR family transcriptional regulator